MARGFKRAMQNAARDFKQVFSAAKRGAKQAPQALNRMDKFATKVGNALDTAGEYAHLAAADTGNERAAQFGNSLLRQSDQLRNKQDQLRSGQSNNMLLNRLRNDFGR